MTYSVVPATAAHALAIDLRASDRFEAILWAPGTDPNFAVAMTVASEGESFVALEGDTPIAIWGHGVGEATVSPWMMSSDLIQKYGKAVIRDGRAYIDKLLAKYPDKLMGNYVASDNESAKLLLKALGFLIIPAPGNSRFHFFFHPKSCA